MQCSNELKLTLLPPALSLASFLFPGLHAQLLSLAIQKVGEGLDGFIM